MAIIQSLIFSAITLAVISHFVTAEGISEESRKAIQEKMLPILLKCSKEFSVSMDEVTEIKTHKKHPDDKNACFFACIFKTSGIMDETGMLSEEKAHEHAKDMLSNEADLKKSDELMHSCISVNDEEVSDGEKGCDRAKLAFNCFSKEAGKLGFMP